MCYTLEELKVRPLPNEVDPTKMETYLTDHDFQVSVISVTLSNHTPWVVFMTLLFAPYYLFNSKLLIVTSLLALNTNVVGFLCSTNHLEYPN